MTPMGFTHLEACPNYLRNSDPTLCICEKYDDIKGLEKIEEYLTELFNHTPEPTLMAWAEVLGGLDGTIDEGELDYESYEET